MSKIFIPEKFEPLFEVIRGERPEVDEVIITGGRESSKTFSSSLGLCLGVAQYNHRVLYTRYTLTSAEKSIIPAFENRAELLGFSDFFHTAGKRISTTHNRGKIDFAGFKTSSGNQTAALKSLEDYSILVLEEAEEYPSFEEYEKVNLSLRAKDVNPFAIMILNPTATSHWIYQKYFEDRGVSAGFNGIKDNVLYIHVTYLDLGEEYVAPKNWRKFENARKIYEKVEAGELDDKKSKKVAKWFKEVVLGGWKSSVDGLIFPDWEPFDEWPTYEDAGELYYIEPDVHTYGLDWGFDPDPFALVELRRYGSDVYLKELVYENSLLNEDIKKLLAEICDEDVYIIADSAEKKSVAEMQAAGLTMISAKKGSGSIQAGIKKLRGGNIYLHKDSKNLIYEANHYHAIEIINNKNERKIHPVDKDNHLFDAARYADSIF